MKSFIITTDARPFINNEAELEARAARLVPEPYISVRVDDYYVVNQKSLGYQQQEMITICAAKGGLEGDQTFLHERTHAINWYELNLLEKGLGDEFFTANHTLPYIMRPIEELARRAQYERIKPENSTKELLRFVLPGKGIDFLELREFAANRLKACAKKIEKVCPRAEWCGFSINNFYLVISTRDEAIAISLSPQHRRFGYGEVKRRPIAKSVSKFAPISFWNCGIRNLSDMKATFDWNFD